MYTQSGKFPEMGPFTTQELASSRSALVHLTHWQVFEQVYDYLDKNNLLVANCFNGVKEKQTIASLGRFCPFIDSRVVWATGL